MTRILTAKLCLLILLDPGAARCQTAPPMTDPGRYFAIEVVDEQTGRGVPRRPPAETS
jgi:hypothetical protein